MRPGLVAGFVLALAGQANAEQYTEIDPINAAYCALYAREMVFIDMFEEDGGLTADSDVIKNAAVAYYAECVSILPALMALPKEKANFNQWVANTRDLIFILAKERVKDVGTTPATDKPEDEEWRRQCRAEYNTWDESTGTVIRRGSPERVKCPCGGEVICGY
jgi:hypothetical protein